MKIKPQTIAIWAGTCTLMFVLLARAADCPGDHPGVSCAHETTSGTESCDSSASGADCDGANTSANCGTAVGRTVNSFPTKIANNTLSEKCPNAETAIDHYTGHNKIETTQEDCTQEFGCYWNNKTGTCYKNTGDVKDWVKKSSKTSKDC